MGGNKGKNIKQLNSYFKSYVNKKINNSIISLMSKYIGFFVFLMDFLIKNIEEKNNTDLSTAQKLKNKFQNCSKTL